MSYPGINQKADLLEMKVSSTKIERFVQTKISFDLGKNGGNMPCALRGRSIVVVR